MKAPASERQAAVRASTTWRSEILPAAVPVCVAAALFLPTLRHGFIWDDPLVLEQLRAMRGVKHLFVPPDIVPRFYYRPFIFATFLFDRWLGGEAPAAFHATVVAWHGLVTALVYLFARELLGARRRLEASGAALLFAVHPIHVESVAWIAGRSDVMATAFVLTTVLLSARTERKWTSWVAGLTALLALLSKETAVACLVLVPMRDLLLAGRLLPGRYFPLALAGAAYFLLRGYVLGAAGAGLPAGAETGELIGDAVRAVGWYMSKLVLPIGLNAYVQEIPQGPYLLGGVVATVGLAVTVLAAWRGRQRAVLFLLCWFVFTLAPSLTVIFRRSASALVADRYLYLPSVAATILVAWCLARLRPRVSLRWRATAAVLGLVAALQAAASAARSGVWADDVAFWSDAAAKSPHYALPHRELADAYMRRDELDLAEQAFMRALRAKSRPEDTVMTYNNLGNLYLRRGRLDEAAGAFEAGLRIYPHPHLYNGLGRVAMRRAEAAQVRGDQAEILRQVLKAREALSAAVAADPRDYKSHVLLGQVLLSLGRRGEAKRHLEIALSIAPEGAIADAARQYLARIGF